MYPYQNKATIWIRNGFTNISVKPNFGVKNLRYKTSIAINLAFGPPPLLLTKSNNNEDKNLP